MASDKFEKEQKGLQEPITFAEKMALASAAMATAVASSLDEKYIKNSAPSKDDNSDYKGTELGENAKKEKKDDFDEKYLDTSDSVDDSGKPDEKSEKQDAIDGKLAKEGEKKKKALKSNPHETKSNKRPQSGNGKAIPRKGKRKPIGTKTTHTMDEEFIHPELLKIQLKKGMIVQCGVSAILLIIGVFVLLGMKWYMEHPAKKSAIVIPKKFVKVVSLATAPKAAAAIATSSLDNEFRQLRRKVRKMPGKSLEGINAKIKLWRDFIDKNEKDHPDDSNILKALAILKNLENVKYYYE